MENNIDYKALAEALRNIDRASIVGASEDELAEQLKAQGIGEGMDLETFNRLVATYGDPDLIEEIDEQELEAALAAAGISSWLGNRGRYCTVTVECMWVCGR